MSRIKNSLAAFGGLSLLITAVAFAAPGPARGQDGGDPAGPTKPVIVVNTAAGPVPVTGTVNVGNALLPVRDVDNPARQLFSMSRSLSLAGDEGAVGAGFPDVIPAGKRLVVEYVTARCDLPQGQKVRMSLGTPAEEGLINSIAFPVSHHIGTFAGVDTYHVSESVRFYLPSGPAVISVVRSQGGGSVACAAGVFGHLVDVPQ